MDEHQQRIDEHHPYSISRAALTLCTKLDILTLTPCIAHHLLDRLQRLFFRFFQLVFEMEVGCGVEDVDARAGGG